MTGITLSEHEREVLRQFGRTWEALGEGGRTVIRCLVCRRVSYHPDDLRHLYCGACARYHEERERVWRLGREAAVAGVSSRRSLLTMGRGTAGGVRGRAASRSSAPLIG